MSRNRTTKNLAEALSVFGSPLERSGRSNIENAKFYDLHEAMWLVAYGGEVQAFFGKQSLSVLADIDKYGHHYDWNLGQHYLAREQIARAVYGRKLKLYGIIWSSDLTEKPSGHVFLIEPEKIDNLDIFEEEEPLVVLGVKFDLLVVPSDELDSLFYFGPKRSEILGKSGVGQSTSEPRTIQHIPQLGRPRKWDWEQVLREIVALANTPDGLPDKQSDLESWVCERCQELFGDEPSVSQIRKKIAPIYQSIRSKGS